MEKISILGRAGSGKSYVAKELGKIFNLPVIYFDHYHCNPDKTFIEKDIFVQKIFSLMNDKWILDGNHSRDDELTKKRFTESNLIVFLDFSEQDCIEAIKQRSGKKRDDIPDYLIENDNDTAWLINHTKEWDIDKKPELVISQISKYNKNGMVIILKNRKQVNDFLNAIKKQSGSTASGLVE